MKNIFLSLLFAVSVYTQAAQMDYRQIEPLRMSLPESNIQLTLDDMSMTQGDMMTEPAVNMMTPETKMDFDFFKQKTNPGLKPYRFLDDVTFVGVPLFVAGIIIKSEKVKFRQNYEDEFHPNTRLITNFKSSIDNYTQYFGPAAVVGLKLAGLEGRSDWPRLLTSTAISYGIMAALVNTIKYTAKEMRPDGTSRNSWPSGHTATSFVGATLLHKEYGLTRSPWFSVAGYSIATATGVMRILNNRHWISDVLSGAGIGIMSTELGYFLSDIIFKGKGLLRNDRPMSTSSHSFFGISMGASIGTHDFEFTRDDLAYEIDRLDFSEGHNMKVSFSTATAVDAEGAYFFNQYVGVGGRLRVRAMTAKKWNDFAEQTRKDNISLGTELMNIYYISNPNMTQEEREQKQKVVNDVLMGNNGNPRMVQEENITIESDHLTEFSANVGVYFNIPLSERFHLGSKLLIGRSMTQELDVDASFSGNVKDLGYTMTITDGRISNLDVNRLRSTDQNYAVTWDYLTLGGNNSTSFGTGLSLTYRYKSNFSWRAFVDYDYARKTFTLKYDPYRYMKIAAPNAESLFVGLGSDMEPYEFKKKKNLHYFTIGGSFIIDF